MKTWIWKIMMVKVKSGKQEKFEPDYFLVQYKNISFPFCLKITNEQMIVNIAVLNVSFTTSCLTNRKFSPWTYTVLIKDALYLTTIIKLPYIPFFPLNFITVITILGNFEQLVIRDAYECIDSPKIRSFTDLFISILTTEIEYHVKVMCHYRFVSVQFLVFHGAKLLVFCCSLYSLFL